MTQRSQAGEHRGFVFGIGKRPDRPKAAENQFGVATADQPMRVGAGADELNDLDAEVRRACVRIHQAQTRPLLTGRQTVAVAVTCPPQLAG